MLDEEAQLHTKVLHLGAELGAVWCKQYRRAAGAANAEAFDPHELLEDPRVLQIKARQPLLLMEH